VFPFLDRKELQIEDVPALDFPWHGELLPDVQTLANAMVAVAQKAGLIASDAKVDIVDLDHLADMAN